MAAKQIDRKFYYYDARAFRMVGNDEKRIDDFEETIRRTLKRIKVLKYSNTNYDKKHVLYRKTTGNYLYMVIDTNIDIDNANAIRFQLIHSRNDLLPCVEEGGKLTPLSKLFTSTSQKLAEITHGVLFLKEKVLGLEYNYAGAKKNDLMLYLMDKAEDTEFSRISFVNLLNANTLKQIKDNGEMSLLKIKVRAGSDIIEQLSDVHDSFKVFDVKNENIDYVELVLRRTVSKNKHGFKIVGLTKEFIGKLLQEHKEDIDTFNVKYGRGTSEIDLLDENFVCKKKMITIDRTKLIKSDEAYGIIEEYFETGVKPNISRRKNNE